MKEAYLRTLAVCDGYLRGAANVKHAIVRLRGFIDSLILFSFLNKQD